MSANKRKLVIIKLYKMKNNKSDFKNFEKWLNTNRKYRRRGKLIQFISGRMYVGYLKLVISDYGCSVEEFVSKFRPGIMWQFISSLRDSFLFESRSIKEQSDLICAIKAYKDNLNDTSVNALKQRA